MYSVCVCLCVCACVRACVWHCNASTELLHLFYTWTIEGILILFFFSYRMGKFLYTFGYIFHPHIPAITHKKNCIYHIAYITMQYKRQPRHEFGRRATKYIMFHQSLRALSLKSNSHRFRRKFKGSFWRSGTKAQARLFCKRASRLIYNDSVNKKIKTWW